MVPKAAEPSERVSSNLWVDWVGLSIGMALERAMPGGIRLWANGPAALVGERPESPPSRTS